MASCVGDHLIPVSPCRSATGFVRAVRCNSGTVRAAGEAARQAKASVHAAKATKAKNRDGFVWFCALLAICAGGVVLVCAGGRTENIATNTAAAKRLPSRSAANNGSISLLGLGGLCCMGFGLLTLVELLGEAAGLAKDDPRHGMVLVGLCFGGFVLMCAGTTAAEAGFGLRNQVAVVGLVGTLVLAVAGYVAGNGLPVVFKQLRGGGRAALAVLVAVAALALWPQT